MHRVFLVISFFIVLDADAQNSLLDFSSKHAKHSTVSEGLLNFNNYLLGKDYDLYDNLINAGFVIKESDNPSYDIRFLKGWTGIDGIFRENMMEVIGFQKANLQLSDSTNVIFVAMDVIHRDETLHKSIVNACSDHYEVDRFLPFAITGKIFRLSENKKVGIYYGYDETGNRHWGFISMISESGEVIPYY